MKRFWISWIAAFVFIFLWGLLYNGILLRDTFVEVQIASHLFRSREEMMSLFHWIIIGDAGLALSFVMIYASGFAGRGIAGGIRLGILLEILAISARCMIYAAQPFPAKFMILATIGGFVEMIGAGIIVGAIYKSRATAAPN